MSVTITTRNGIASELTTAADVLRLADADWRIDSGTAFGPDSWETIEAHATALLNVAEEYRVRMRKMTKNALMQLADELFVDFVSAKSKKEIIIGRILADATCHARAVIRTAV